MCLGSALLDASAMAFYRPDQVMQEYLALQLRRLAAQGREGLLERIAITWVRYDQPDPVAGQGWGAAWAEQRLMYPASAGKSTDDAEMVGGT